MAKQTTYGPHLTRGGLAVRALLTEHGALEALARKVKGKWTRKPLASSTLSLALRGHRPIASLAEQLAAKTGVALEWFAEKTTPPVEEQV